jgi:hypothetical protein
MAEVFDLTEQKFMRAVNTAMKLFVVEYSFREGTTSIRTLENVLRDNYKKICNGISKDYLPVGLFKSREDADRFDLHFHTVIAPQAQLDSGSRRWKQIADCFTSELEDLLHKAEFQHNESSLIENKTSFDLDTKI